MKKIALIVPSLTGGGAEKVAADLSLYFVKKGYEVIFFVRDVPASASYAYCGKIVKIPVIYNREKDICKSVKTLQKEADNLKKWKETYKIDISISFMQACNLLNILSRVNDKVIVSLHSVVSERRESFGNIAANKWVYRYLYQLADKIIFVSEYCRKDWICNYGDLLNKTKVIYNPIGNVRRNNKIEPERYGEQVIISVARMDNVKRPWHIIRMFSCVLNVYPDASLLMLGGGELLSEMRKLVKELGMEHNVYFLGNVENVDDYLDVAKVFVLASASESFGCSVVEAMRCGVPVVANDCPGGLKELLQEKCGIITPYIRGSQCGGAEELTVEEIEMANAVIHILSDDGLHGKLAECCRRVAKQYHLKQIGLRWENELIGGKVRNIKKKKAVTEVLRGIAGLLIGAVAFGKRGDRNGQQPMESSDKFIDYFTILDKWMYLKEEGKKLTPYFLHNGYKKIAIYGMGKMGRHLINELANSEIEVAYGIDRNAESLYAGIPILGFEEEWVEVDAIVVTVTPEYANISKHLREKINCPIVNLKDVIFYNI